MSLENKYVIKKIIKEIDLYYALGIRAIVFINEQACPFSEEFDNYDTLDFEKVQHFIVNKNNEPVATARVIYKSETSVKLGRIALLKEVRSEGLGSYFVTQIINYIKENGYKEIQLNGQIHLEKFYNNLGFKTIGEPFYEAGIKHIEMRLLL